MGFGWRFELEVDGSGIQLMIIILLDQQGVQPGGFRHKRQLQPAIAQGLLIQFRPPYAS
jgi:hypothetical protein